MDLPFATSTSSSSPQSNDYMEVLMEHPAGYDMSTTKSTSLAQTVTNSLASGTSRVWDFYSTWRKPSDSSMVMEEDDCSVAIHVPEGSTLLSVASSRPEQEQVDLLALLLQHRHDDEYPDLHQHVRAAEQAKRAGNWTLALEHHAAAAKQLYQAGVDIKEQHGKKRSRKIYPFSHFLSASLSKLLFSMSQIQARSVIALQQVIQLSPSTLEATQLPQQPRIDRLRATVRGALEKKIPEADLSESTFLGKETLNKESTPAPATVVETPTPPPTNLSNPLDEMMALERELREMDMTVEAGSSLAAVEARKQKNLDGSFMVVGANSYMSSSNIWTPSARASQPPRARNRVQAARGGMGSSSVLAAAGRPHKAAANRPGQLIHPPATAALDASWMDAGNHTHNGNTMGSSIASLASSVIHHQPQGGTNTKQLMRLMDSLKTLGDENAALLKQLEGAEDARAQAKTAYEEMQRFKQAYERKFKELHKALDKHQKGATPTETPWKDQGMVRKLTHDLRKEKEENRRMREESKKKDAALRKYEKFYKEVKARSAQKLAARSADRK